MQGSAKGNLWTAKKRVRAEVQMTNGLVLQGSLYADLLRVDGAPATIAEAVFSGHRFALFG